MHLGCEAGPLDEVGTGLGSLEAAVRPHGRHEDRRKSPAQICCCCDDVTGFIADLGAQLFSLHFSIFFSFFLFLQLYIPINNQQNIFSQTLSER